MSTIESVVQRGLSGGNKGLHNGLYRGNSILHGTQRKSIVLVGGGSGTGKSTLAFQMGLLAPYFHYYLGRFRNPDGTLILGSGVREDVKINFHLYSYEMSQEQLELVWMEAMIKYCHNIEIPMNVIKGATRPLHRREKEMVFGMIPELEAMVDRFSIETFPENPTGIYKKLFAKAEAMGTFEYETYFDAEGNQKQKPIGYTPNDPDVYNIVVMDYLELLGDERGMSRKQVMDKFMEYCVFFRNLCGFSFILIQQFNNNLTSTFRDHMSPAAIFPSKTDFGSSSFTFRFADQVIGMVKPDEFKFDIFEGYKVENGLGARLVLAHIIKNRYFSDIGIIPLIRANSWKFNELPPPDELSGDMGEAFYREVIERSKEQTMLLNNYSYFSTDAERAAAREVVINHNDFLV